MSQEDKCTETLEGDKIGCIYSVMIKMATTTNVQETTEDRRRQKYRKNNPKLVQLSNFKFSAKVKQVQKLLPKKIGQLPGATKIHELVFEIDGRILKKNLPDENSYKQVLIKLGRFPARPDLNEAILEPDDLDDLDE